MNHFIELTEAKGVFSLNTELILSVKSSEDGTILITSIPRYSNHIPSGIPVRIEQHQSCIIYEVKESYEQVMALIHNNIN